MRLPLTLALILLATQLAGCTLGGDDGGTRPTPTTRIIEPPEVGPPLNFSGIVVDARDGSPVEGAVVRVDLSQTRPCRVEGIVWTNKEQVTTEGRFGPIEFPRPRSDDVAFFVHAAAPGYSENVTHIGGKQAGTVGNMTIVLHPIATISGTAPPGTVVALDDERFPRLTVADANGTFAFENARVVDAHLVAGTDVPARLVVRAPREVTIGASNATAWHFEGKLVSVSGAPMSGDVIARVANSSALWSVARAGDNGIFVLPLAMEEAELRIDARTSNGQYGASKTVNVKGTSAVRDTLIMRALC